MTTATPEPGIDITGAAVDFPIFDAKTRSLKKAVLGRAGGGSARLEGADHRGAARHHRVAAHRRPRRARRPQRRGQVTLLRLMSGIYEPTRGRASVVGKVAPVFDLAVGMDPEISGFDNILIAGCSWV
jgi:ABC-2 type transport system ATP-binding protein